MEDDTYVLFSLFFGLIIIGLIMGVGVGVHMGKSDLRKEAVAMGVAHYEVDKEGNPVFTWNKVK